MQVCYPSGKGWILIMTLIPCKARKSVIISSFLHPVILFILQSFSFLNYMHSLQVKGYKRGVDDNLYFKKTHVVQKPHLLTEGDFFR